jgi:hypothetical protein
MFEIGKNQHGYYWTLINGDIFIARSEAFYPVYEACVEAIHRVIKLLIGNPQIVDKTEE